MSEPNPAGPKPVGEAAAASGASVPGWVLVLALVRAALLVTGLGVYVALLAAGVISGGGASPTGAPTGTPSALPGDLYAGCTGVACLVSGPADTCVPQETTDLDLPPMVTNAAVALLCQNLAVGDLTASVPLEGESFVFETVNPISEAQYQEVAIAALEDVLPAEEGLALITKFDLSFQPVPVDQRVIFGVKADLDATARPNFCSDTIPSEQCDGRMFVNYISRDTLTTKAGEGMGYYPNYCAGWTGTTPEP